MRTLEMKIAIPEINGGRCISAKMKDGYISAKFEIEGNEIFPISGNALECRINPNTFAGEWLEHQPETVRQKMVLDIYQDAKAKGRLHPFTCMTIDASVYRWELVYQKGLPIRTDFSLKGWIDMLKEYNPSRNSRMMTRTEYECRNLFLIQKLVESGYEIAEAWKAVCDDSRKIGHYLNSDNPKNDLEPTGSREVCGFCDLGNTWKLLAEDPWETDPWKGLPGIWVGGGCYYYRSTKRPVVDLDHINYGEDPRGYKYAVGMLALD